MGKYCEQLYANKLDNMEEGDKFLEKYSLPKLNQEESENLNRQNGQVKLKQWSKNSQETQSSLDPMVSQLNFTTFQELASLLPKLLQKIQEDGSLLNLFYEANIILTPKPDKDTTKKKEKKRKLSANILDEHRR